MLARARPTDVLMLAPSTEYLSVDGYRTTWCCVEIGLGRESIPAPPHPLDALGGTGGTLIYLTYLHTGTMQYDTSIT